MCLYTHIYSDTHAWTHTMTLRWCFNIVKDLLNTRTWILYYFSFGLRETWDSSKVLRSKIYGVRLDSKKRTSSGTLPHPSSLQVPTSESVLQSPVVKDSLLWKSTWKGTVRRPSSPTRFSFTFIWIHTSTRGPVMYFRSTLGFVVVL